MTYHKLLYDHEEKRAVAAMLMHDEHGTHGHFGIIDGNKTEFFVFLNTDGTYDISNNPLEKK